MRLFAFGIFTVYSRVIKAIYLYVKHPYTCAQPIPSYNILKVQSTHILKTMFNGSMVSEWFNLKGHTVIATAKLTSFSFLLKNEDAYFRERKRIFQRTKTQKNENAKKRKRIKTNTQKNASLLGHFTKACRL